MTTKIHQKTSYKFICEKCDFKCSKKGDYNRHLKTRKHNDTNTTLLQQKIHHICECGKSYNHRASLYNHKKKCTYKPDQDSDIQPAPTEIPDTPTLTSLLMELIETNKDLKNEIIDLASKPRTINNNKTFNLNNFLNVDCKDAMNLSEFIDSIKLTFKDLLYVGNNGFIKSFKHTIIDAIATMEQTKRPIHCTDIKRKTLKVKDNDIWETDKHGEKVKKTVDDFSRKQLLTYKFHHKDRDPDFLDDDNNLDNNNKIILGMCQYTNDDIHIIQQQLLKEISKTTTIKQ